MIRKVFVLSFYALCIVYSANAQSSPHSMKYQADSAAQSLDSLIAAGRFFQIIIVARSENDTVKYYHRYFIDTTNNYLVKFMIDTVFQDYYKIDFKQAVFYFYGGH